MRLWDAHRVSPDLGARPSFLVWCGELTAIVLLRLEPHLPIPLTQLDPGKPPCVLEGSPSRAL